MPQEQTRILVQEEQPQKRSIKSLAYSTGKSETMPYRVYRLDRSTPVYRRGVPVVVVPRFKGLVLYTPTAVNGATKAFQTNLTGVAVKWPSNIII